MSAHLRRARHFLAYLRWHVDQGGRGVIRVNRTFRPPDELDGLFEDWPVR